MSIFYKKIIGSKAFWIFLLALSLRLGYLAFNLSRHIPDGWGGQARHCLYYAQYLLKTPPAEMVEGVKFEDARGTFLYDDNGLVFVHYLLGKVLGRTSFRHMQILHLLLDSLLIFPIMGIGWALGGDRGATLSGIAYAFFLPEIWLATSPGYDFWATWGLLSATALYLKGVQLCPENSGRMVACFAFGTIAISLAGIIRSAVIYFPFIFLFIFIIVSRISLGRKLLIGGVIVGVWGLGLVPKLVQNYSTYGHFRVVRNTLGLNFWLGVGQYPNPYGIESNDSSVQAFYTQLTGEPSNKDALKFEIVLVAKAKEYIRTHPLHYAVCVTKRFISIFSGISMRCAGFIADVYTDAPGKGIDYAEAHARGDMRQALIQEHGPALGNFIFLLKNPARLQFMYLLLMPVGLLLGLYWERKGLIWLAASPMIYTLMTLSPFDFTGRNVINAYAAVLPVCMMGFLGLYDHLKGKPRLD